MITIRHSKKTDQDWIHKLLENNWGGVTVVSRGRVHEAHRLPGLVALIDGERRGLVTYHIQEKACEIVTLDSLEEGRGIGTKLVEAVHQVTIENACERLWLITTNDNLNALGFYQKRGFELVAIHRGAMEESRRLKPSIPEIGQRGIPIRDEIEMVMKI